MKIFLQGLFLALILCSCGSLRVLPKGCKGPGEWAPNLADSDAALMSIKPVVISEDYLIWNMDTEVRLKDFLKKRGLTCDEVKRIRAEMTSSFFVRRNLTLFIYR
jgi:hypothetical protein